MIDVVFAITGDVRRNSRALRQIRVLNEIGLNVEVLSHGRGNSTLEKTNTRVHWLSTPKDSGPAYFWKNHQRMAALADSIHAAAYHASDLYTLPALAKAADRHGGSLIYDARELYPYVASTVRRPWARFVWKSIERRFIRKADGVITVSNSIADKLVQFYGIYPPVVMHNVPPRPLIGSSDRLRTAIGATADTVIVLHQGQMRKHRGCERLVAAMREISGAVLVFLGNGPLRRSLAEQVQQQGTSEKVFFLDSVPPDELLAYTASADLGVTLLQNSCLNHTLALPNKLFEYLAADVPVIASNLPEIRKVVVGFNVGVSVEPMDQESLIHLLRQSITDGAIRDRWRDNIPAVFDAYSFEISAQRLRELYEVVLKKKE